MCRWFAYISPTEPCLLEDVIVTPKHCLVKQVNEHYLPGLVSHDNGHPSEDDLKRTRNNPLNFDGIGIAWYTSSSADFEHGDSGKSGDGTLKEGLRPCAYKTTAPPVNDINFRSICANTETRVLFAHIRASSGSPIVSTNNHPFMWGRHCCMHNGTIFNFNSIRRAVCARMSTSVFASVLGSTDSEHIFGLYMTYLTKGLPDDKSSFEKEFTLEEMAIALHDAVATVCNLQKAILGDKMEPNSLNLCVTDGKKLIAYRFRNSTTQEGPSLYWSTTAGTTLNRKYPDHPDGAPVQADVNRIPKEKHGKHLIVASEPSTYREQDWHLIGKNQLLLADENGVPKVMDIPYDAAWNVQDMGSDAVKMR